MTTNEWITVGSVLVTLVSSTLAVYIKLRQTKLETEVESAKVATASRIDETKAILEAWKEVSRDKNIELASIKADRAAEVAALKVELREERSQHQQCARLASRMEGQLAALMNTQPQYSQGHPKQQPSGDLHIDHVTVETLTSPEDPTK